MVQKHNTYVHKLRWLVLPLAIILATTGFLSDATAADPSFVGALAIAVEDGVAERLGLSDEARAKLVELINLREDKALEIVLANKDLPPFEQTARLVPFVTESERLGFALLTVTQREKLQHIRTARQGMSSLVEPGVAQSIGLSAEQQTTVKRLLDERAVDMTKGGENERRITRAIYERKLAAVLNDQQRGNWQTLAGLADAKVVVAKADTTETQPDEATQEDTEERVEEEPAPAEADTSEDPAMAAEEVAPSEAEQPAEATEGETEPAAEPAEEPALAETPETDMEPATEPTEEPAPTEAAEPAEETAEPTMEPTEEPAATTEETPASDPEEPAETTEGETEPAIEPTEEPAPAEATEPVEGAADAETEPSEEPAVTDPDDTTDEGTMESEEPTEEEPVETESDTAVAETEAEALPDELRFNFQSAPWKDVLNWFCDTADLSFDGEVVPHGTFSYRDDRVYSVEEAIDLLNSYLLTKGYTLIRRERILLVWDYEGDTPIPDPLVTLVSIEELDKRGKYEYLKCLFNLARMTAEDAADMVDPFLSPYGKVTPFPNSRQILVVETGGKLRAIRDMIARVEEGSETVVEVQLEHISAEEFLTIGRGLLGLDEGQNSNDEIRIAIAVDGKTMYVTANPDKLSTLRGLVPLLDKEPETPEDGEEPETLALRTYFVKAADPEVVLRVLQTLLADMPGVRMEMDMTSGKLVALAYPAEHTRIEESIKMLEGQAKDFKVIKLNIDPELAVAAVNKFFGLVAGDDEEAAIRADAPIVDGDPISMQMWVRGTAAQIEQIEDLVTKLEAPLLEERSGGNVRIIPLTGPDAITALENAQLLWGRENKIRMVTPSALTPSRIRLRTITPLDDESGEASDETGGLRGLEELFNVPGMDAQPLNPNAPATPPAKDAGQTKPAPNVPASKNTADDKSAGQWPGNVRFQFASQPPASQPAVSAQPKTAPAKSTAPEIRVAITPGGIFIASDDLEALDAFEKRLRDVAGPTGLMEQRDITVFYLKYAKADVANALLQEILSGHVDDSSSSLLGDVTTDLLGGGLLGGLLGGLAGGGGGDDTATIYATGTVSIVPDPRLNALVVEANPTDVKLIEELLKVIDRESSVTDIQTAGTPYPIVVKYATADEVAAVVREVFADKIATTASRGRQQPSPEDLIRALRGGQRGGRDEQSRGEEQKMTIGVDQRTNSIIVVAPEPLYRQVEALVELIDQPGLPHTDYVEVVPVNNAGVIAETLENVIAQKAATGQRTSSSGQPGAGSSGGPTPDQIRQRIEMFQRLRGAAGGGMMGGRGGPPSGMRPSGGAPSRGGPPGRGGR